MTKHQMPATVGGKTIDEWETEWVALRGGLRERHHQLDGLLGLLRLTLSGRDMFIGSGIDIRQGIPKRLYDFHRPSPSGRNHHAGQLIYEHRDQLEVQVLMTGEGRQAQRLARQLRPLMLERHEPVWNVPRRAKAATPAPAKVKAAKESHSPSPRAMPAEAVQATGALL